MINLMYVMVCLFATYGIICFCIEIFSCFNKLSINRFRKNTQNERNESIDIICSFKNCEKYADYVLEGLTCGKYELLSDMADNVYIVDNHSTDNTKKELLYSKWNIEKYKNIEVDKISQIFDFKKD